MGGSGDRARCERRPVGGAQVPAAVDEGPLRLFLPGRREPRAPVGGNSGEFNMMDAYSGRPFLRGRSRSIGTFGRVVNAHRPCRSRYTRTSSTRRLRALPSSVVFGAIGCSWPKPAARRRSAAIPAPVR